MRTLILVIISVTLAFGPVNAQNHLPRLNQIDVRHYRFEIGLNDSTNVITGKATILITFKKASDTFYLDFDASSGNSGDGMVVTNIKSDGKSCIYSINRERLLIQLPQKTKIGETHSFTVSYSGIPKDGLIISKNRFGDRCFFADNWPDRAHFWIPVVDHPSDKATVEFIVTAPDHYQVVSNGHLTEETNIGKGYSVTHWSESEPVAAYVMVIGVAQFAVQQVKPYHHIPVSTWVFPQNKDTGFKDYDVAEGPLRFYSAHIGPYPYEKLANVQSKTRYGGMENASCIFYNQRSVNGRNNDARLFAHEIAHQWFGNSVTERNWYHIWLSEGFATYLTNLYTESTEGEKAFIRHMETDRDTVIRYVLRNPAPVVDTTVTNYMKLLNPNSYEKASWILHMLRVRLGDRLFWKGLRLYYNTFKDSTALTSDFENAMETVYKKPLHDFFHQWLYCDGIPVLKMDQSPAGKHKIRLSIDQVQADYVFHFPLEINVISSSGKTKTVSLRIESQNNTFTIRTGKHFSHLVPDPGCKLLYELYSGK